MTTVIGMRTTTGAILIADCLFFDSEDPVGYTNKISHAVSIGHHNAGGIYTVPVGYFLIRPDLFLIRECKHDSSLPLRLLSGEIRETTMDDISKRIDALVDERDKAVNWVNQQGYNQQIAQLDVMLSLRGYIEHTNRNHSNIGIIFSKDETQLIHANQGELRIVDDYICAGSAQDVIKPYFEQYYQEPAPIKEALSIGCIAMNQALSDSKKYKGYSLVIVENRKERIYARTAIDYEATQMDVKKIKYLDEKFQQPKGLIERVRLAVMSRL